MATRMFDLLAEWRPRWTRKRAGLEPLPKAPLRDEVPTDALIGTAVRTERMKDHRRPPARHRPAPPPRPASNM